jgi:hypothetical protein
MSASLSRQQWRAFERRLRKLMAADSCSLCGAGLVHNCQTYGGHTWLGEVALAADCCVDRLVAIHTLGLFSERRYDFLAGPNKVAPGDLKPVPSEQLPAAIAAHRKAIAVADDLLRDAERDSGITRKLAVNTNDHEWTAADREWFERHPKRSHRLRAPIEGEVDAGIEADFVLVRQAAPGIRVRAIGRLHEALPLPASDADAEALAFALFEIVSGREPQPPSPQAFTALIKKYRAREDA